MKKNKNKAKIKPNKFDKGIDFLLRCSLIPRTNKGTLAFAVMIFVAQPLTGQFFKTGQEYLEENGYKNTEIVDELTGGYTPHIRDADFIGKAHSFADVPVTPYIILDALKLGKNSNTAAYARRNSIGLKTCNISISSALYEQSKFISKEDHGISKEEYILRTFFHEFAHCNKKEQKVKFFTVTQDFNKEARMFFEADAEYRAIKAVEKTFPDSKIAEYSLMQAAITDSKYHSTFLYLDAKLKGEEPPTMKEIIAANDRADNDEVLRKKYIDIIFTQGKEFNYFEENVENRSELLALKKMHGMYASKFPGINSKSTLEILREVKDKTKNMQPTS